MPVEMLADPEGFRDAPGGDPVSAEARREAERCAKEKVDAIALAAGAKLRAALYDPSLITDLSVGVAGLMLAQVLNGTVVPKDAKQAIDIAKTALAIADVVDGANVIVVGEDAGPEGRAARISRADALIAEIRERTGAELDRAIASTGPAVDLDEFDLDDDEAPAARLRAVP